jgi:hypothetical protein
MSFHHAGRFFEAFLFAVGAYYGLVENRSMLATNLGLAYAQGSLALHDLWHWREFASIRDLTWQWGGAPLPLQPPRAASLAAAVALRMPSLVPLAAGAAAVGYNASSSLSSTSAGDDQPLHALLEVLRNSSHRLECQQRLGQTFMYYDAGALD